MLSKLISVGDKIDLIKITNGIRKEKKAKHYVSQLLVYDTEQEATIATPIIASRIIPLSVGDEYQLCFYTSKGLWQCNAVIINRHQEKNIYVLVVRFISDFEKFQRRQYYRMDCFMEMEYRIETEEERLLLVQMKKDDFFSEDESIQCKNKLGQLQSTWISSIICDISGGGLRCNSIYQCQKEDTMIIRLHLGNNENNDDTIQLILSASVILSIKLLNKIGFYEHRVEFTNINIRQREHIIRFIFQEERQKRRREKGLE